LHGASLQREYRAAIAIAAARREAAPVNLRSGEPGAYIEFDVFEDRSDSLLGLEDRRREIELVTLRSAPPQGSATATVFVPASSAQVLLRKLERYTTSDPERPKNQQLVSRLNNIRAATIRSLWTGSTVDFPDAGQSIWWEVWLRKGRTETFEAAAVASRSEVRPGRLAFPERDVRLVQATPEQMQSLMDATDAMAELRRAKDSPGAFIGMPREEQADWVAELLGRIRPPINPRPPAVCVLDTGINNGHPLLLPVLDDRDRHAYRTGWGLDDSRGHGTQIGGLAIFGDLYEVQFGNDPIRITHVLESVKILPPIGDNPPELYGLITDTAIRLAEIQSPDRRRVACLAVTSDVEDYHGRPSSWSSTIDQLCYGEGDENTARGFVLAAGNVREDITRETYLHSNDLAEIEDPAQAWNAITVGAYTEKDVIVDPVFAGFLPVAPVGDLTPTSRTSINWDSQWPIKPDIVFEGGNLAAITEADVAQRIDDLSLLTTYHAFNARMFTDSADTSAATALAARFYATVLSDYPDLRPETIRALMVHSADWTAAMSEHAPNWSLLEKQTLLRRYGYGVPNLDKALRSARNEATLLVEDEIQPFIAIDGHMRANEMNVHTLPWPVDELLELEDESVELRITLSYYIQPNPGERGWLRRHRYTSHGLRFDVQRAAETLPEFRRRINAAIVGEDDGAPIAGEEARWRVGERLRNKGSIHSDYWYGSAVDLASRSSIAVYPIGGWWKENPGLDAAESIAKYSLVVTLKVPEVDVDIHTPILAAIQTDLEIEIE
jgi:hypothetical protein